MVRIVAIVVLCACATTRSPERYREDTHTLLETRSTMLEDCYQNALAADPRAAGRVTIHFVVQKGSGNVANVLIDGDASTAPAPLVRCVLRAVDGLRLRPPDSHEGRATFVYDLKPLSRG
jgi:hypothetical protein